MTSDQKFEYLRDFIKNYWFMSGDYLPILDAIQAELNNLRAKNKELVAILKAIDREQIGL